MRKQSSLLELPGRRALTWLLSLVLVGSLGLSRSETRDATDSGDAAYRQRALVLDGDRADPERIRRAIEAYEDALRAEPESIEVRWRLLRALYYLGDFAAIADREKAAAFVRGRASAEETIALVADRLGAPPVALAADERRERTVAAGVDPRDLAELFFWASVHWGAWSRDAGLVASVREGVANRVFDYARVSAELDPSIERGGAHRLLSRLHATMPRVPFVSGWVDRELAVPEAKRALGVAPDDSGNQFLLAITLLDLEPGRREEAVQLLARVAATDPRPEWVVEDRAVRQAARERLEASD